MNSFGRPICGVLWTILLLGFPSVHAPSSHKYIATKTDMQALLMSACSNCSLDDCIMLVSIYSMAEITQTLIHIHCQEPYRDYGAVYASELAMQGIARMKWYSVRTEMQHLLGSCDVHPLAQSLCGYIVESYDASVGARWDFRMPKAAVWH